MTKLQLPLKKLQAALTTVATAVERRTTIPILGGVLIEADGERGIHFTTTNLDLAVRVHLPERASATAAVILPAVKLYEYSKLLGGEDAAFSLGEEGRATLRCGRSSTKLPVMALSNFPKTEFGSGRNATAIGQEVLSRMLRFVMFAISDREASNVVTGALLEVVDGKAMLVATDGHRLARYTVSLPDAVLSEPELLPLRLLTALNKMLGSGEPVEFEVKPEAVFASVKSPAMGVSLSSRKLMARFPNYRAMMPRSFTATIRVDAALAAAAVKRCLSFADERSGAVRLTIGASEVRMRSASESTGETEETLEVASASVGDDFREFQVGMNGAYLLDAFSRLVGEVDLRFSKLDGAAPLFITSSPIEGELFEYVVMPQRI